METIKKGENKFYMGEDETVPIAEINFYPNGEKEINIDHVYVARALRKQGIGKILVDQVVAIARTEHKRINPVCSYAEKVLTENDEYTDVLICDFNKMD
ncbi:MAG: GNAT family N-acetyltransferase [Acetobacterium sp.]